MKKRSIKVLVFIPFLILFWCFSWSIELFEFWQVLWLRDSSLRSFNRGRLTPWAMNSDHGRWPFSMVRLSWYDFLKKQFTKSLGPKCGPRGDDHAPKNEWVDYLNYMSQKSSFNLKKIKSDHSLVFIFFPQKNHYNNILLLWARAPPPFLVFY